MKQTCQITGQEFEITEMEQEFMKKMDLPLPLHSPKMREIMRMAFRNERNLFMRTCDATGEKILSIYSDRHPFPVYKYDYWMSDKWEVPSLDYDFDRPFFEQYQELSALAPRVNLFAPYNENCDYVNGAEKNKNCYMHILSDRSEDCYYTHGVFVCQDCIDCAYLYDCELCYESTDCRNCYHCRMCFLCDNSSECSFCFDMRGCHNCFFSNGLRNQQYCFNNQQLSKEEYETKVKEIEFASHKVFEKYRKRFINEILEKAEYKRMINTENSDGNFLINTKNCHRCYDVEDSEDCFWVRTGANGLRDIHHCHAIVDGSELVYGNVSTTEAYNCHNVIGCWTSKDSFYGEFLQGCRHCVGCISQRYKKYCVLNKQYSPEEYEKILSHIKEELGEYFGSPFPLELAPFTFLESAYLDYHDISREELDEIGWEYGEIAAANTAGAHSVTEIPDQLSDFDSDDLQKVFLDESSNRPFKITPQELKLLQKIGAPIPRKHYEQRFQERVKYRKRAE
jgi:hypothetical protein